MEQCHIFGGVGHELSNRHLLSSITSNKHLWQSIQLKKTKQSTLRRSRSMNYEMLINGNLNVVSR